MCFPKLWQLRQNGKQDLVKRTEFDMSLELGALCPKDHCAACGC
jgi:hypothetical protein